jgi:glycosyltransferase involved in cell wall biosynthesis
MVPLISIVIPAFNEEKNILSTLRSLSEISTTYPVEILVVNNNS